MVKVALNEKNEWIELEKGSKQGMYIDGYHKATLDTARKIIKEDWDMVFVYDGMEGSGKSVKCLQDAFYCDPTLNIDRITFNPEDFKKACMSAKKYQAVVLDEAYGGLSSRGAMGAVNKSIVQMLTVIRQKNLFIYIVLPTFFDLDRYVAIWRSRALIHVYTGNDFQRGFFEFYNIERKKNLFIYGKKTYDYKTQKANYRGRFMKTYTIDEGIYREKKMRTSVTDGNQGATLVHRKAVASVRSDIVNALKYSDIGLTVEQQAQVLSVTRQTLSKYMREKAGDENFDIDEMENEVGTRDKQTSK